MPLLSVNRRDLSIAALGSGSDYTPFLQHLTIASLSVGYGGEGGGGSYHSIFDSFDHYSRFRDPEFAYGVTLAKTTGRMTLRFANADVLPLRFRNLADHVNEYLDQLVQLADDMREETKRRNALVADNSYELAADPKRIYVPPDTMDPVPYINFAPLRNAAADLERAAEVYDSALERRMNAGGPSREDAATLNAILVSAERALGDEVGLPRRPWFQHTVYAPGFYTGYGVETLPGVREGIEQREWREVEEQIDRVAKALERLSEVLDEAARVVGDV